MEAPGFLKEASSREMGPEHRLYAPAVSALWRNCCGCQSWLGGREGQENIWRGWGWGGEVCSLVVRSPRVLD